MRALLSAASFCLGALVLGGDAARAQDWRTAGYDAQRSQWVRSDRKITTDTVKSPQFELLWKMQFENEPRQMSAMTPPVLLERLVGFRGFRALAFFGTSSGRIYAVDTDLGLVEWEKRIESGPISPDATIACPGGLTAGLARPTRAEFPPPGFGGARRRTPATSGVGQPAAGAITLQPQEQATPRAAEDPTPSARVGRPVGNPNGGASLLYALTSDGMFHSMHASNGATQVAPIPFLPPNVHARGLIVIDDTVYVATVNGCGGVPDGVWALNMETKEVTEWPKAGNRTVVSGGIFGFAMGSDGKPYVSSSDGAVSILEAKTLSSDRPIRVADGISLTATPMVVDFNNRDYMAVAGRDKSIRLLPSSAQGSSLTATGSSPASALATWKDEGGTTWILASTENSVDAWKIVERNGAATLERGWTKQIAAPLPPMIVNGVVFAAASGEHRGSNRAAGRVRRSKHARLYALNGETGVELWNSSDAIQSFSTGGGLAAGNGNIYVSTYDGALYSFGFPIEH
jgi:outer membrane protein assembly factor BamB